MRSLISLQICCVVSSKLRDHRAPHAFISLINRKLSPSNISGHNFLSLYVYSFLFFLLRQGNERNLSCPSCSTKKKAFFQSMLTTSIQFQGDSSMHNTYNAAIITCDNGFCNLKFTVVSCLQFPVLGIRTW